MRLLAETDILKFCAYVSRLFVCVRTLCVYVIVRPDNIVRVTNLFLFCLFLCWSGLKSLKCVNRQDKTPANDKLTLYVLNHVRPY